MWSTFMVGQQGFWISFIALQALMARLTDSDGRWLGLLFFTSFVPALVLTPLAGVVADRVERKQILVTGYIVIVGLTGALAALTLSDRVTPGSIIPFALALGTVFAFNAPASQSIVANAVPTADLPSAVSLQAASAQLARVTGPTLAAPLLALWNEGAAFAIYSVASVIVAWRLRGLHLSPYTPEKDAGGFWSRLRGGIDHARERPPAVAALSMLCMSSLFAAAYLAVLPVVAADVYDRGARGFTVLAAVTGLGSTIGALTTGAREGAPTLSTVGLLVSAFGASMVLFALVPTWPLALAAIVVVGIFYFAAMTTLSTLLQYLADDDKRGRMMSLFVVGWAGLVPLGGLWQGLVAEAFGVRTALAIAGTVTCVYAFGVVLVTRARARTAAAGAV